MSESRRFSFNNPLVKKESLDLTPELEVRDLKVHFQCQSEEEKGIVLPLGERLSQSVTEEDEEVKTYDTEETQDIQDTPHRTASCDRLKGFVVQPPTQNPPPTGKKFHSRGSSTQPRPGGMSSNSRVAIVASGELTSFVIVVHRARNLLAADRSGLSDPYCIVHFESSKKPLKTKIRKKTLNPSWEQTFVKEVANKKKMVCLFVFCFGF